MTTRDIPTSGWAEFLDSFSHRHHGWLVDLLVRDDDEAAVQVIAAQEPLRRVELQQPREVDISFGGFDEEPLTKVLCDVRRLSLETTDDGTDRGLEVEAADGAQTVLRFRVAAPSELVDGMI